MRHQVFLFSAFLLFQLISLNEGTRRRKKETDANSSIQKSIPLLEAANPEEHGIRIIRSKGSSPSTSNSQIASEYREGEDLDESQTIMFNPPSHEFLQNICRSKDYACAGELPSYGNEKKEVPLSTPCGTKRQSIRSDGNCGFRALSYLLTGTEENHDKIRHDVIAYEKEELRLHRENGQGHHDWWNLLADSEQSFQKHISDMEGPAASNAQEERKWVENVDLLAAARLYNVNVMVCSPYPGRGQSFYWQRYVPGMAKSVLKPQNKEVPSLFIYFDGASHFEAILDL